MPRLRVLAPWLLALLALAWALAPHVPRDSLRSLAPHFTISLIALALIALVALALITLLILRARRRRHAPPRPPPHAHPGLARTLRAVRRARPTRRWLCVGLPGHGKTTLLASAGPRRSLGDPDHQLHLLDSTHELQFEHSPDLPDLPRLLAHRGQPLDLVLLVLRLPDLLSADLPRLAEALRAQLAALSTLAIEVPLILVCTHLDRLAGHHELTAADPTPWSFELSSVGELAGHLRTWTTWVASQRLAQIAAEPDPELRARLHTFAAEFTRACDRLLTLGDLLLPTLPGAHLRAVHFTALKPGAPLPADTLLTDLATRLHLRLLPRDLPPLTTLTTDTTPLFTAARRLAREATRTPAVRLQAIRRRHLLAAALALTAAALALTARAAAQRTHERLQSIADLGSTLAAPDPIPPLLALRRELDLWPATATLRAPFTPPLHPTLAHSFRRHLHERLLAPIYRTLTTRLPDHASHDELRAYLLLTAPEHVPNDMSQAPGPLDPDQQDWLLATLPRLATLPDLSTPSPPLASPDLPLLLATFFTLATPADLRFPRDHALVERTRARLRAQDDDDALVAAALAHAAATCEPLTLAALTHAEHLVSARPLACSFTRDAWPRVHDQLLRAAEHRDAWVLARPADQPTDRDRLTRLRSRHASLHIAAWTDFLAGLRVRRPADLDAVARLLTELTGDERPLARIFTALEQHTRGLARPHPGGLTQLLQGSDHPEHSAAIVRAFTPLLNFTLAGEGRQSSLDRYHARLAELLLALDAARRDPAELPALQTQLTAALADTRALLQPPELRRFRPLLEALLLPPLDALQSTLRDHDKLALTAAWCAEIDAPLRDLVRRYPFTRDARDELSLPEFTAFFHPTTGTLRRFRDAHLAPLLEIHGDEFSAKPTARADAHPLAPAVLALLARADELAQLAFPTGELGLDLDLDLHCNADIGRVRFTLDGATHSYTCGPDHHARMRWPGPTKTPGATLELLARDDRRESIPGTGPWGLFRLLEKDGLIHPPADRSKPRLVFHLDLHASRLGSLDLTLTVPQTRGATLLFGAPTRTRSSLTPFLAPLRDPAITTPPTTLFTGLPTCAELPP